ncbi:cyclic nucleotide-binding domain-containing protein [Desulfatibacillum aliphaticivorans]|nr:cyclic nucleotide-binding domain-containing protein [Desulfatibacillum aliphaticivorans]
MVIKADMASNYLLDGLGQDQKSWLLSCFTKKSFKAGEQVFRENDKGDELFFVESGRVIVKRWITEGNVDKILLTAERGDVFGEMAFVDYGLRTATAYAEVDSMIRCLSRNTFNSFCEKYPNAGAKALDNLLRILTLRLRATTESYVDAVQYNVQVSGTESLGFQHLITSSMTVEVLLTSGASIYGTVVTVEKSEAGFQIILRQPKGGLIMTPYHAIACIYFDADKK